MARKKRKYKDYGDPCACCKTILTPDNSYPKRNGVPGVRIYCRNCERKKSRAAQARKPSKEIAAYQRSRTQRLWDEFLDAYGGRCACCGEGNAKFLTIDHVNNDGWADQAPSGRRRDRSTIIMQAKRDGWPDTLQLLCYNCNCGKARNGKVCPHKDVAD